MIIVFSKALFITVLNRCFLLWLKFNFVVVSLRSFQYRIDRIRICIRYNRIACLIACELKQKKNQTIQLQLYRFRCTSRLSGSPGSKVIKNFKWDTVRREIIGNAEKWKGRIEETTKKLISDFHNETLSDGNTLPKSLKRIMVLKDVMQVECTTKGNIVSSLLSASQIWFYNFVTMPENNVFR